MHPTTQQHIRSKQIFADAAQLEILKLAFNANGLATNDQLCLLEEQTGLPKKWISSWFCRERRKTGVARTRKGKPQLHTAQMPQENSSAYMAPASSQDKRIENLAPRRKHAVQSNFALDPKPNRVDALLAASDASHLKSISSGAIIGSSSEETESDRIGKHMRDTDIINTLRDASTLPATGIQHMVNQPARPVDENAPPTPLPDSGLSATGVHPQADLNHNYHYSQHAYTQPPHAFGTDGPVPISVPASALSISHNAAVIRGLYNPDDPRSPLQVLQSPWVDLRCPDPHSNQNWFQAPDPVPPFDDPSVQGRLTGLVSTANASAPIPCVQDSQASASASTPLRYLTALHRSCSPFEYSGKHISDLSQRAAQVILDGELVERDPFQAAMGLVFLSDLGLNFDLDSDSP